MYPPRKTQEGGYMVTKRPIIQWLMDYYNSYAILCMPHSFVTLKETVTPSLLTLV